MSSTRSAQEARRPTLRAAALLALAAFLVYNANLRIISTGDSLPARFIPFAIWKAGTVRLDPVLEATRQQKAATYWILDARGGGHASQYPIVTPLLVTPLYAPAALYLRSHGWREKTLERLGEVMEKLAASCVAAVCSGLMFLLLRRRMSFRRALLLAAAFAFGTETWAISSQALWQHGPAELLLVVALLAMTGPPTAARLVVAGLACGLVVGNRPFDLPLAGALTLFAPLWARRRVLWFLLGAALPMALVLAYNLTTLGDAGGGYGVLKKAAQLPYYRFPMWRGMIEMLFSPGKGLFPFTPFLLFLPLYLGRVLKADRDLPVERQRSHAGPATSATAPSWSWGEATTVGDTGWRRWRPIRWALATSDRALALCLLAGILGQVALYGPTEWQAGSCYGPRFLTDMLPLAVWLLAPVVESLRGVALALFSAAVIFSTGVQAIGAICYPRGASDVRINVEHSSLPGYVIEAAAGPTRSVWLDSLRGARRQP